MNPDKDNSLMSLLQGNFDIVYEPDAAQIRIFLSSTFTGKL